MPGTVVLPPLMLIDPVAGVAGVPLTVNVKCVESVTVITKVPLYSVCVAPETVTDVPVCQFTADGTVTVAVAPLRVIDVGVTSDHPG